MNLRAFSGVVLAAVVLAAVVLAPAASPGFGGQAPDPKGIYTRDGLGASGFDVVAYFTEAKAVAGNARFEHEWGGVRWRFSSAAHLEAFARTPERYAPQYGGYCAYAVARNYTAPTDPSAWKVVDGKLYLNYDQSVRALWEKELPEAIRRADGNWPGVLSKPSR